MSPTTEQIRAHVTEVLTEADRTVSAAYLFGSQARGDARDDSDIDIALIDDSFADTPMYQRGHWFKREWDYLGVGPLELFCLTPDEFQTRLDAGQDTATNIDTDGVDLLD